MGKVAKKSRVGKGKKESIGNPGKQGLGSNR